MSTDPPKRRWWPFTGSVGGAPLPLDQEQWVDRIVARGIYRIALTAVLAIAFISVLNSLLQAEVLRLFDDEVANAEAVTFVDESVSVLGNIAAAGVGALAGWWSRGMVGKAGPGEEADPGD